MNAGDFLDANCRINGMWLIPSPCSHDELRNEIEMAGLPVELKDWLKSKARWSQDVIDDIEDGDRTAWDCFFEELIGRGKSGWLIKADTPVYDTDSGSMSYSWGYYHHSIIFAEDVTQGLEAALKWASDLFDAAKATVQANRAKADA